MVAAVAGVTLAMTLVMFAAWVFQRAVQSGGWVDVFWTYGTGATCALAVASLSGGRVTGWRPLLVASMHLPSRRSTPD